MKLKSLEIKGFKSFADKTVVNFDEGITGVIGPNGCGKSNIIDSIRWVIGEQKISSLRSENLESLVFNGSKNRSASGLAEVSLTFENTKNLLPTEFNTVTVTRKYYKNGESEYRLNDVSCRLRDIQNLFMDTGISTDSYAIIELGMVDDIIRDKDNSRRRMLEQAAGVTIYKTRKKEAKSKLDATQQDLARIEDLLYEINHQLKTLESQARKAERYHEAKKEYQQISIELAKVSLEGFHDRFEDLNTQQQQEQDKRVALEAQIAQEEAVLEQEKLAVIEQEKTLQQKQSAFNELIHAIKEKENQKNLARQQQVHLREKESQLTAFLSQAQSQLEGLEESIAFTTSQLEDENVIAGQQKDDFHQLKQEVETRRQFLDQQRSSTDAQRQGHAQMQKEFFEAEKKVAVWETSIQNLQRSILQMEQEQNTRQSTLVSLEAEKEQKEALIADKRQALEQAQQTNVSIQKGLEETRHEMEMLRNKLALETRTLDARQNEFDLLKSMIDKMEGYPDSVKFLHNNAQWNVVAPLLSDVIYVQEAYRAAVENILEPFLNYYVVDNVQEAIQAVQLLEKNRKGKAKFFILDQLKGAENAISDATFGIHALKVIEADGKYLELATHLLGNVVIVDEWKDQQDVNGYTVLERSGRLVKGLYTLAGGSIGAFEGNKIGRAKNLEKLREQIAAQSSKVMDLKEEIGKKTRALEELSNSLKDKEIQQGQKELNQLINSGYAVNNKMENLVQQMEQTRDKLADLREQLADNQDSVSDTRVSLEELRERLETKEREIQENLQSFYDAERAYTEESKRYNDANLQLTRQQSKLNALQQELQFKNRQLFDLNRQIEDSRVRYEETSVALEENGGQIVETEDAIAAMFEQRNTREKELNDADQLYHHVRNTIGAKENALKQKQRQREQCDALLNALKDKLNELRLSLAGMKERLHVEFKVELDQILDEERTTSYTQEELETRSEKLRRRIENIGEVNPTAIEAYSEMKKRFDFIAEQKNDLVDARDSLLQTIQEVESTANQKFLDTFNKVRENFQQVFKALFTEDDTADMVLMNPDNLAETGIDILAKPKGKRPTSITQLSGGEKTLTATALLFAIYLIKPAPFCILDEVDAPLDDANVNKFTQMIRQFSTESQFIIVTHNKTTMATVDMIYGVTMQEPGVSKLVPVDFRGLEN